MLIQGTADTWQAIHDLQEWRISLQDGTAQILARINLIMLVVGPILGALFVLSWQQHHKLHRRITDLESRFAEKSTIPTV